MSNTKQQSGRVEGTVVKTETKHFLKLIPESGRSTNLPISDRSKVGAVDPMYTKYQLFTRVLVTVQYGDSTETLKSSPLDVSEVFENNGKAE